MPNCKRSSCYPAQRLQREVPKTPIQKQQRRGTSPMILYSSTCFAVMLGTLFLPQVIVTAAYAAQEYEADANAAFLFPSWHDIHQATMEQLLDKMNRRVHGQKSIKGTLLVNNNYRAMDEGEEGEEFDEDGEPIIRPRRRALSSDFTSSPYSCNFTDYTSNLTASCQFCASTELGYMCLNSTMYRTSTSSNNFQHESTTDCTMLLEDETCSSCSFCSGDSSLSSPQFDCSNVPEALTSGTCMAYDCTGTCTANRPWSVLSQNKSFLILFAVVGALMIVLFIFVGLFVLHDFESRKRFALTKKKKRPHQVQPHDDHHHDLEGHLLHNDHHGTDGHGHGGDDHHHGVGHGGGSNHHGHGHRSGGLAGIFGGGHHRNGGGRGGRHGRGHHGHEGGDNHGHETGGHHHAGEEHHGHDTGGGDHHGTGHGGGAQNGKHSGHHHN